MLSRTAVEAGRRAALRSPVAGLTPGTRPSVRVKWALRPAEASASANWMVGVIVRPEETSAWRGLAVSSASSAIECLELLGLCTLLRACCCMSPLLRSCGEMN